MTWDRYFTVTIDDFTFSLESLILKITKAAQENNKKYKIGGGWVVEFTVGKMTRNHHDIDLFVRQEYFNWWVDWFKDQGFTVRDSHKEGIFQVFGNEGESLADIVPAEINQPQKVSYKDMQICVEDVETVLKEKLKRAKSVDKLRPQDLHDFLILGKEPTLN